MYTHILVLWIKGSQLFRNYMSNATDNKSFGPGLTSINEVRNYIVYLTYDMIIFFWQLLYNILYNV